MRSDLNTVTDSYVRVDGSRKRNYLCRTKIDGAGVCSLPKIDAEKVDQELVRHLGKVWIDFDAFISKIAAGQTSEAGQVEAEREAAVERLADLQLRDQKLRERYAEKIAADEADIVEQTLLDQATKTSAAERRVQEPTERLESVKATAPVDESLDTLGARSDELQAILSRGNVREVREGLERRFVTFIIDVDEGWVEVTPRFKRLPIYQSWGQPIDAEQVGSDSWESLAAVPS